jgi:hypothetical protein
MERAEGQRVAGLAVGGRVEADGEKTGDSPATTVCWEQQVFLTMGKNERDGLRLRRCVGVMQEGQCRWSVVGVVGGNCPPDF